MKLKDLVAPFYVWKRAFEKPYTSKKPLDERRGSDNYRGFHCNKIDKCIGCGTCEAICPNKAIDLVPVNEVKTTLSDSGLRPRLDYGRCCWCALCVDVCTTESLTMTNEYKWIEVDPDNYRFTPGIDKKSWDTLEKGYKKHKDLEILPLQRESMTMLPVDEGVKSFLEMVKGYSLDQAQKEARRCLECGLCVTSCPAQMNIPRYIRSLREGNLIEGFKTIYQTNPLSAACGRICTRRCEEACSLNHKGDPVAIRWLKRYIADQMPLEQYKEYIRDNKANKSSKKVAVIGAGPGGLSTAYYLVAMGYDIEVFEGKDKAGGMLRYGVPSYRLPYDQIDKEISFLESLGVKFNYNSKVDTEKFNKLMREYDAVFFATGLTIPYGLGIEGENHQRVLSGLQVLEDVTFERDPNVGKEVAVIGGGNVAMDAARVSRRMGANVSVLYRRRIEDMPADNEEIHEAQLEGVKFVTQAIPIRIEINDDPNKVNLVWAEAEMVKDPNGGRPRPRIIEDKIHTTIFDSIISAIGQEGDFSFISNQYKDQIEIKRGKVIVNNVNQTKVEKLFVGGDIVNNTADAISAIADGLKAARGIDRYLNACE